MGIAFKLTLESLQFYRVKHQRVLNLSFVLLLLLRFGSLIIPYGNRNFDKLAQNIHKVKANPPLITELITPDHLLAIGIDLIVIFVTLLAAVFYARCFVLESTAALKKGLNDASDQSLFVMVSAMRKLNLEMKAYQDEVLKERNSLLEEIFHEDKDHSDEGAKSKTYVWLEGLPKEAPQNHKPADDRKDLADPDKPLSSTLRYMLFRAPQLLLLFLIGLLVFAVSAPFLLLPFFYVAAVFAFSPLLLAGEHKPLWNALKESRRDTYGAKGFMLVQIFFFITVFSFIEIIGAMLFENYYYSFCLIDSMFFTLKAFILARLWAIFFMIFADGAGRERRYPSAQL